MKMFEIHQVILQEDGRISLTCDCCRRPSAYNLIEAVSFIRTYGPMGIDLRWDCQFENCLEPINKLSDSQVKTILGFPLKNNG